MQLTVPQTGSQIAAAELALPGKTWPIARWPWVLGAVIAVVTPSTTPPLFSGNFRFMQSAILAIAALVGLPLLPQRMPARKTVSVGASGVIILSIALQIGGRFDFQQCRELAALQPATVAMGQCCTMEVGQRFRALQFIKYVRVWFGLGRQLT